MSRKDINVYGISFIDLLSGALAAVIILFIIVPKLDMESKEASKKLAELGLQVDQLDSMVVQIENSVDRFLFEEIKTKIKVIQKELQSTKQVVGKLEDEIKALKQVVEDLQRYKAWMDNCGFTPEDDCPPHSCPPTFEDWKAWMVRNGFTPSSPSPRSNKKMGFEYFGDNVLYIVDISGSMQENNRLLRVKAGLKMLIVSLEETMKFDIIAYPDESNLYKSKWGELRNATESNKEQMNSFLYKLTAVGFTPTRKALEYALTNHMYSEITDIVLLSDGAPSIGNSDQADNIKDILDYIQDINKNNVRVSTIGVGEIFQENSYKNEDAVVFLRELAAQNGNGFFVGF